MNTLIFFRARWQRVRYAMAGFHYLCRSERNMRVHVPALLLLVAFGLITGISFIEWALLLAQAFLVIAFEAVNTAIERLTDRVCRGRSETARVVKDLSAAAVWICSVSATISALLVFLPKWYSYV